MRKLSVIVALTVAGIVAPAQAALLYTTNFNSPTYSNGALIGQDSWAITGTVTTNAIQVANVGTDGNVPLTTTGQDVNRQFTPDAASTFGTVTLRADINVSAAQSGGDYFLHFGDGGSSLFYGRTYARSSGTGFQLGGGTSSGTPTYGSDVLSFNTTYSIEVVYSLVTGTTNDTGTISVDGSPYTTLATTGTDLTNMNVVKSINLRQGSSGSAPTLVVDNLSLTTFIPEPTSLALLGGAASLLVARRRR